MTKENKETTEVKEEKKTPAEAKNTPVAEPVKEEGKVGLLLKEMRNKLGKTFEEVSQELCIRKSYLEAIENSDYNNIPEYPYGIGFIRSYADYLGLDGNEIVQLYKEEAEADFRKNHPYFVIEPQVEATVPNKRYLLVSMVALFVVYGLWNLYNRSHDQTQEQDIPEVVVTDETTVDFPLKVEDYSTTEKAEESQADTQVEEPEEPKVAVVDVTSSENKSQVTMTEASFVEPVKEDKKEEKTEAKAEDTKPAKSGLTVNLLKDTWIEVRNDKTLYISKVLKAGESYTLPKAEGLRLSVGKAHGVEVLYNGKKAYEFSPNKKMNISVDEIIANTQD